jgi:hypothetical protein
MVPFYDPRDQKDLDQVEQLLHRNGIEYFLQREPVSGIGPFQILVDEADIPKAQELMELAGRKGKL